MCLSRFLVKAFSFTVCMVFFCLEVRMVTMEQPVDVLE